MRDDHPIEKFALILRCEPTQELMLEISNAVEKIASRRCWTLSPPSVFIEPGKPLSIEHNLYSAQEPWNKYISREVDRKHYEEVRDLIKILSEIPNADFEAHLEDIVVGRIRNGQPDQSIMKGLLEPWDQTTLV